ncbi:hypothetical protein PVN28_14830 [Bacillus licheniformis]|uniref:hypothetical protein n=1 Tax=Bacillus licheniformis TaxID=1402 RepID=UPI00047CC796|nr:hypothetical protein [Bacillus licheniformis]MCM3436837.1 hypothetical protein [Bacillus licheniformis]MDE1440927.1 hypothetical protein [Bacillus licheniformis]
MEYEISYIPEKAFKHALDLLKKKGIILDENTYLGSIYFNKASIELIETFKKMGYEGALDSYAVYFNTYGAVYAIFDTDEFPDCGKVKAYLENYVENYAK